MILGVILLAKQQWYSGMYIATSLLAGKAMEFSMTMSWAEKSQFVLECWTLRKMSQRQRHNFQKNAMNWQKKNAEFNSVRPLQTPCSVLCWDWLWAWVWVAVACQSGAVQSFGNTCKEYSLCWQHTYGSALQTWSFALQKDNDKLRTLASTNTFGQQKLNKMQKQL